MNLVLCDGCGELVPADLVEVVCGWSICVDCRRMPETDVRAAAGYDYAVSLPPFWGAFGDIRGMN